MKTITLTTTLTGPFYAFPASQANFANWNTAKRVELTGSAGRFSGSVNTTTDGAVWYVFRGATAPTSWSERIAIADFTIELAIADQSITVYPLNASDVERVNESTIITYLKEIVPVSVPVSGDVDLTTKTLQIIIEKANSVDKVVIANADIDTTESTFTFTVPEEVTAELDQFSWILREVGTNIKLAGGRLLVKYAPFADEG